MAESSKGEKTGGAMRIDPSLVRELAELLHANELTEIEVEDGDRLPGPRHLWEEDLDPGAGLVADPLGEADDGDGDEPERREQDGASDGGRCGGARADSAADARKGRHRGRACPGGGQRHHRQVADGRNRLSVA